MKRLYLYLFLSLLAAGCGAPYSSIGESSTPKAKNVILMIGDGMGLSQITAAALSREEPIAMTTFPVAGLHKPHAYDELITDSAAGATAFATGVKTKVGLLGLNPEGGLVKNIIEEAKANGYAAGLVTTATIVHPTPAAFYAHLPMHNQYEAVAQQLAESDIDLFIGGGRKYFLASDRETPSVLEQLEKKGYNINSYLNGALATLPIDFSRKMGYFTAEDQPTKVQEGRDYLPIASRLAPRFLQRSSENGFFLMIEGAQIDWAGHENDQDYLLAETLDFDEAVAEVLKFAERDKNTLVIVTADHETGGYSIQPGSTRDSLFAGFSTDQHTGILIPVLAYGPGSSYFRGMYDNTAVYDKMKKALGW